MILAASSTAVAKHRRCVVAVSSATLAVALTISHGARADDPAAAETLFRDAMTLFDAGNYTEACPKLADSQRLDPASGTLFALALCHEREGKLASAWGEYINAAALSRRDNRADRESTALKRARDLEPQVSRLMIRVEPSTKTLAGLDVRRNGEAVPPSALDTALPVDPGEHVIEARAPRKKSVRISIRVQSGGDRKEISLPSLEDESQEEGTVATPRPIPKDGSTAGEGRGGTRALGFIVGGVGLASVGVGTFFGLRAVSDADKSKERCPTARCIDPDAVALNDEAGTSSTLSNIFIGTGAVAAVVGAYFLLTSPSKRAANSPRARFDLDVTVRPSSAGIQGAW